jgi:hypothetical protein
MPQVKGTVIASANAFVVARHGDAGWREVLSTMDGDDRDTLAAVVPVGWYDIALYDRFNRALVTTLGRGDLSYMAEVGRFAADHDMKTVFRVLLRMLSPATVMERSTDLWRRYQDSGVWTIERPTEKSAIGALRSWGSNEEATCERLGGYLGRLLELSGSKGVRVARDRCRSRGDDHCRFHATWT